MTPQINDLTGESGRLGLFGPRRSPSAKDTGTQFAVSNIPAANVASVPQRSPLRYPGGKTWLVPHIRAWLSSEKPSSFILEPFGGGAIVSLTAVIEGLAEKAAIVEKDADLAAFWRAALERTEELIARIERFRPSRAAVQRLAEHKPDDVVDHGFRTLVLNRTRRGGVLAAGASLSRSGENGNGIASRWYPQTLQKRLRAIAACAHRIAFYEGDGVRAMEMVARHCGPRLFVDPPYTAVGGKKAGSRLYTHSEVDHARIFEVLADTRAPFLMTYDCSSEVVALIEKHKFHAVTVEMKNGHHVRQPELVITPERVFA